MTATSLALVLAAAAFHATSNLLIKQARDKLAFTWWMLGVSSLLGLPIWLFIDHPPPVGWWLVIASGLIEAIYFAALTRAYALGTLSQVYPIARGSAQPFTVLWGILFLHERPSAAGVLGVAVIVAGLYVINLPSLADWKRPLTSFRSAATRWSLLTGLLISLYSAVDKEGIKYFTPISYLYLILVVGWLALTPQWLWPERRAALLNEIRSLSAPACLHPLHALVQRIERLLVISGCTLLGSLAYVLILAALQISPVSYVGPAREVSVVVGAWLGVRIMGEPGGALRIWASVLIASGVLLIAGAG
jgi:drug/metabolite transporter (DMT)-like permease